MGPRAKCGMSLGSGSYSLPRFRMISILAMTALTIGGARSGDLTRSGQEAVDQKQVSSEGYSLSIVNRESPGTALSPPRGFSGTSIEDLDAGHLEFAHRDSEGSSPTMNEVITIWSDDISDGGPIATYDANRDEFLVAWASSGTQGSDVHARKLRWDGSLSPRFLVGQEAIPSAVVHNHDLGVYLIGVGNELFHWDEVPLNTPIDTPACGFPWPGTGDRLLYNPAAMEYIVVHSSFAAGGLGGSMQACATNLRVSDLLSLNTSVVFGESWSWYFENPDFGRFDTAQDLVQDQLLVVHDDEQTGDEPGIFGRVVSASADSVGDPIPLTNPDYRQIRPALASGPDEYLMVFGQDTSGDLKYEGYGMRLSPQGIPVSSTDGFWVGAEQPLDVGYGAGYGYLVIWIEGGDIRGRYVLPFRDQPYGESFSLFTSTGTVSSPSVVCAPSGDCLVVFTSSEPSANPDVFGRFVFAPEISFPDVLTKHWAFEFIESLAQAGLTSGFPDGTYRPDNPVTRAEMAVFLKKGIHGSNYTPPATDGSHPFGDIEGHWAEDWIEDLFDEGFTSGFPDRTYRPDNQGTRAEMAVFLKKAIHGSAYVPPTPDGSHPFSDIAGHWAEGWMEDLYDEGITSGYPDGTYRPENQVTRAEMAVLLVNAFSLPLP